MKSKSAKYYLLVVLLVIMGYGKLIGQLPSKLFENQRDFSYMWWMNTVKTNNNRTFAIKTNKYALAFDYSTLSINNLLINSADIDGNTVLRESNAESFPTSNQIVFNFGMVTNGTVKWCTRNSGVLADCQLVESGKYFHRRFINKLPDLTNCDSYNSGLEISSWSDRLTFILRTLPTIKLQHTGLIMSISFPSSYSTVLTKGDFRAFKNPANGSGYIVMKSKTSSDLTVLGSSVTVRYPAVASSQAGIELSTGMIIYPVSSDIDKRLDDIYAQETSPLTVTATQKMPANAGLNVAYDPDLGWHQVMLRNDGNSSDPVTRNNRMEQVSFSIANTSSTDKTVRLNFAKERQNTGLSVFSITGISAVLRDASGNPIGIPVQLSKNWHTSTAVDAATQRFRGTWYRGLCVMTVPANTTVSLEYTSVNALWGGVPAASHAQLCLVGWGANQLWEQAAIGSWGESITYEPDLTQAGAPVLDFRPLMIKAVDGALWGWTGNMGGADIFNYKKTSGTRAWHSRMRTQYKRYSPNLTEVIYAGVTDDNAVAFEYSTSVGRSDDIVRGIYKIKMQVLKDFTFSDFVFFQAAAATYKYTRSNTLAWGNETGLVKQWNATIGSTAKYITEKEVATGNLPWFSFTNSVLFSDPGKFLPANRGFVIRKWNSKINGIENVPPSFAEFCAVGGHGQPSGIINITPPKESTEFKKGDYLEAEIVLFQFPMVLNDYYGPNTNLVNALTTKVNTWKMVYREAIGNNLELTTFKGIKISDYPVKIEAVNDFAHFSIAGGLGYVPITITNVSTYLHPELYEKRSGSWVKINQSKYGNDFWQTDYNAGTGKWEVTYTISLDTENDTRTNREFKFHFKDGDVTQNTGAGSLTKISVTPSFSRNGNTTFNINGCEPSEKFLIKLLDSDSKVVYNAAIQNSSDVKFTINLKTGVYLIWLQSEETKHVEKIIISGNHKQLINHQMIKS
ncbi:MAG: hypothetical protein RBT57_03460 [Paludibacter sp.]|jgi:hypothetical protein|nr:hypothetical protein [Paludibacter sp.]